MKKYIFSLLLLSSCALSHEPNSYCDGMTVSTENLSLTQEEMVHRSVRAWNRAAGVLVLVVVDQGADLTVTSEELPGAYLVLAGDTLYIGPHEDQEAGVTHALGTLLGVPDDNLPRSIMHGGAWPQGDILPVHVERIHSYLEEVCL